MSGAIEWADAAWNPTKQLDWPLRWRGSKAAKAEGRPSRIVVKSDLFHEEFSDETIAAVFGVMTLAEKHTFQVLTKHPERRRRWFEWVNSNPVHVGETKETARRISTGAAHACIVLLAELTPNQWRGPLFTAHLLGCQDIPPDAPIRTRWPLPNVWLGVPVEDQPTADERIPLLLSTPAAKRFVSYEPALGPVDVRRWLPHAGLCETCWNLAALTSHNYESKTDAYYAAMKVAEESGAVCTRRIDWLIFGGESGPGARPCDLAWARSARDQCKAAGVPFFMKQLGALPVESGCEPGHVWVGANPMSLQRIRHPKGGDPAEWPEDLRVRETP